MSNPESVSRRLEQFPTVKLAQTPTALEPAPRLGHACGVNPLWVKRDDSTGLALGGNKARKLEFLVADALAHGADTLLTTGGVQSNHARMTAAAARRTGMRAILFLCDSAPDRAEGNLLLDRLLGAEVRFIPGLTLEQMDAKMEAAAEELRADGRRPYIIPVGGSTPLGALGYVRAVAELAAQCRDQKFQPGAIVLAAGSTGTLAGVLLGVRVFLPGTRIYGVSVSPLREAGQCKCAALCASAARLLGVEWSPSSDEIPIWDDWLGSAYAIPTPEGDAAVRLAAECEGYLLDPVYTGKALAGLIGLAARGEIGASESVVFWHTGGSPALFAGGERLVSPAMGA